MKPNTLLRDEISLNEQRGRGLKDWQKLYNEKGFITFGLTIKQEGQKKDLYPPKGWAAFTASQAVKVQDNALAVLLKDHIVIDLDRIKDDRERGSYVDGLQFWTKMTAVYGEPQTVVVETPSGGVHYYFQMSDTLRGVKKQVCKPARIDGKDLSVKIDFLTQGAQVIAAGSENPIYGTTYKFKPGCSLEEMSIAAVPEWLETFIMAQTVVVDGDDIVFEVEEDEKEFKPAKQASAVRSACDFTMEEMTVFLNEIDILARDYDSWRDVVFSLYNMFDGELRDTLIHYFSKGCRAKYDEGRVSRFIANIKPRDCGGYKVDNLRRLCKKHKLDRAAALLEEMVQNRLKSKQSIDIDRTDFQVCLEPTNTFYDVYLYIRELNAQELSKPEYLRALIPRLGEVMSYVVNLNSFCLNTRSEKLKLMPKLPFHRCVWMVSVEGGEEPEATRLDTLVQKNWEYVNTYENITFMPLQVGQADPTGPNILNTWLGFKAQLLPESAVNVAKCNLILNHIREVLCGGDERAFDFLIGAFFGEMFRDPASKKGIAVNLVSKQGTGKGIIIDDFLIKWVYGDHIATSIQGISKLTQRFNSVSMNKLLISVNELPAIEVGSKLAQFDVLKALITDTRITVEIKNGPTFEYPNYARFIFSTNNELSLRIEDGDRRYMVLKCSDKYIGNAGYFEALAAQIGAEAADHFFSYCYYYKTEQNPRRPVMTAAKQEVIETCSNSARRFLLKLKVIVEVAADEKYEPAGVGLGYFETTVRRHLDNNSRWISAQDLYSLYKQYCCDEGESSFSNSKFGKLISEYISKRRVSRGCEYDLQTIIGM